MKTSVKKNRIKTILVLVIIAALVVSMLIPYMSAFAEETSPTTSPSASSSTSTGNDLLSIDSSYLYGDMIKAYSQGYQPLIGVNDVWIFMPLVYTGSEKIADETITVSYNLGDASTSPFVFNNFEQKIGKNAVVTVKDTNGTVVTPSWDYYFIPLNIGLIPNRVNGRYPVVITTSYLNSSSVLMTQTFTVYVTIENGIDPNATPAPSPTPTPTPSVAPQSQPKLIVSEYSVNPEIVMAGSTFTVDLTLRNTSKSQTVKNIVVTYKGETSDLMPESGTNSFYVASIGTDEEETFSFTMKVRADVKPAPQKIILTINYEDETAQQLTASDEILVQLKQPIRLKFDTPNVSSQVFVGDSISASMNLYNLGKNILYNVMVTLEANGFIPEEGAYLGNMESGTNKTAEIYAAIEDIQGMTEGNFVVTYEDEYGESYTEKVPFTSEILPMQVMEEYPTDVPVDEGMQTGMPVWGWVLIIAGGVAAVLIVLIKLKKKKAAILREEDEDDLD